MGLGTRLLETQVILFIRLNTPTYSYIDCSCLIGPTDELLPRYLAGANAPRGRKFLDVDYDRLLAVARQQKAAGSKRLKRVQQLSKRGKESREAALLKKHREVWEKERTRLLQARRKSQVKAD